MPDDNAVDSGGDLMGFTADQLSQAVFGGRGESGVDSLKRSFGFGSGKASKLRDMGKAIRQAAREKGYDCLPNDV